MRTETLAKTCYKKSELNLLDNKAKTKIALLKIELKELISKAKITCLDYGYGNGFSPLFYQKKQLILCKWSNEMARCGMEVW